MCGCGSGSRRGCGSERCLDKKAVLDTEADARDCGSGSGCRCESERCMDAEAVLSMDAKA